MSESAPGRIRLPGQQLREAREAQGLSQAEMSARLHLSVSYIRALEADDYSRLPQAAFVRGYIRNYARLVNLPGDELASLFQQIQNEMAPPVETPAVPPPARDYRHRWWIAGAAGFVAVLWLLWPTSVQQDRPVEMPAAGQVMPDKQVADQTAADVAGDPEAPAGQTPAALAEPVPPEPAVEPAPVVDRLLVRFGEACWLRVRDRHDNELFVGQRDAGQSLQLEGDGPFRLTLGNAAAVVAIEVNGDAVPVPAAAPGQVITVRTP